MNENKDVKDIGVTVKKNDDFSEWYTQIVLKAQLADYSPVKGFIVLRPYGYKIWELLREQLDKQLKTTGHENGFLPILIPESLLSREEDHFSGFTPEVFWVTQTGDNKLSEKLAIRPTSETLAYQIFSKWIMSYRDLPLKLNFWNSALRAEIKSTKPFIRNSEFLWQEGHTVHAERKEAEDEVYLILGIYKFLIEQYLAIPTISGFKSDKEKFVGAVYTTTLESLMPDGKALQMATSHNLGQNFSKPFDIKFLDSNSKQKFGWQTSWGISWRIIGAIVMTHGDDKGLILPPKISPIQVVIVPIYKSKDKESVLIQSRKIFEVLEKGGIRVYIDTRDEYTSGWKFHDWELKGVPLRINIGSRDIENKQIELVRRDNFQKLTVASDDDILKKITSYLEEIQLNLFVRAKFILDNGVVVANDYAHLKKIFNTESNGFVKSSWCGKLGCEEKIKEETGADIRVIPFDDSLDMKTCVYCNEPSTKTVFFAKAY